MYVIKRNGEKQEVHFDKITLRISRLAYGLNSKFVDPVIVAQKTIQGVYPGVTTSELDDLSAQTAAFMATTHVDYSTLAARISVSNLHKNTLKSFSETMKLLRNCVHPVTKEPTPLLSEQVYLIIEKNRVFLDSIIEYNHDFNYDYFGFKTMEKSYLLRIDGKIVERPQHMLMRVAIAIHLDDMDSVVEYYDMQSRKLFTHATPTLFNAGTPRPQMSSCFLLKMKKDSIEGIYGTLAQCALISKYAGGIGLSIHDIRARGSYVAGTNGYSNGIVPMLRVFDATARYVDQGGGKRKGSFAVYLEPWHADVKEFLELKFNNGKEQNRARDLFYALWIPDLFMKRVENDEDWSLFCPNEAKGLSDVYGDVFEQLYTKYEKTPGLAREVIKARELWNLVIKSQLETGTPYMLYKDSCNEKSNQKNIGILKSSNLCTEILQVSSDEEVGVCNLASINLSAFVDSENTFNFKGLLETTKIVTKGLNRVIDNNYYPVPEAEYSNKRNRPLGIGVQGLADVFVKMRFPFESSQAAMLNRDIFETIYFGACSASADLAEIHGHYATFPGSPISQGIFQFDMWGETPNLQLEYNWDSLRSRILKTGIYNSLLIAPMPTASTSQILGNNESFEPFTSNIYSRRVLSGDFFVINKYLVNDLIQLGLWCEDIKNQIIKEEGSVQNIREIPNDIKALYKTVWEIKQKSLLNLARGRSPFIDQSQSINSYFKEPTHALLNSMHFYGWKLGLKTGMYYLRRRPAANPIQFTLNDNTSVQIEDVIKKDESPVKKTKLELNDNDKNKACGRFIQNDEEDNECEACGS